jgi:Helix-turn-helix domain
MTDFIWRVATHGHVWRASAPLARPTTIERFLGPYHEWDVREYEPLREHTGLFQTFAYTEPTEEAILAFADEYGPLGGDMRVSGPSADMYRDHGYRVEYPATPEEWEAFEDAEEVVYPVDPFKRWREQIERMKRCVEIWKKSQGGEASAREMAALERRVNREMEGRVTPRLGLDRRGGGLTLQFTPVSLLGALWFQLAQAIGGNKQYRACASCGRWFEVSPDTARADAVYCKEACRSRAYRARKERAARLAAEGRSAKEIAAELGSDVKTVQGWLKKKKQ